MKHKLLLSLIFCCICAAVQAADAAKRPNIILIYTDDHAFQAIGAYGCEVGKTPQLDRLANEGMKFTNCCVTNSICGPMRAVVQTGKYSHVNGFIDNRASTHFDNTQVTFPKLLQAAGYNTAIVGKWHLNCDATPGFDYSEVLIDQGPYFNPTMIRDGKRVQHQGYTTEIITDLALDWLKNGRDPQKPFLLLCQHKATHRSWDPIPKYYDRFKDTVFPLPETFYDDYSTRGTPAHDQNMSIAKTLTPFDLKLNGPRANMSPEQKAVWNEMYAPRLKEFEALKARGASENEMTEWKYQCYMRDYFAVASAVDDSVGEILAYLEEAGLDENTLVIYSSDQGFYLGEHGWFDKRFMYEESYKTAFLARWKGQIAAGSVNSDIVSPLDFAETFLDLAGVEIPQEMQGASVAPMLLGQPKPADWRTAMFYRYYEFPDHHHVHPHEGVYDGRFKLMHFIDLDEWELYDLSSDPHELRNLISDPAQAERITALKSEMERQKKVLKYSEELSNRVDADASALRFGGSAASQKAVARGLEWLSKHQCQDGSWNYNHLLAGGGCNCSDPGSLMKATNGATAMGILPFLGCGQTHRTGKYKGNVYRGLTYLCRNMKTDRKIPGGSLFQAPGTMYNHGLASICLTEAYAMTKDEALCYPRRPLSTSS